MKTIFKSCATVLALILCTTVSTFAQSTEKKLNPDSAQVVLVNLNDDFELYGIVKKMKNGLVYFQSEEYGEIKFEESELNWFEEIGHLNLHTILRSHLGWRNGSQIPRRLQVLVPLQPSTAARSSSGISS